MAITVVQRVAPASGTASLTPSRTIAQGVVGNVLYVCVAINTATDSTITKIELGAAGSTKLFTAVGSGVNNNLKTRLYWYRRVLVTGDTETTVTVTQSQPRQNTIGAIELSGSDQSTFEAQVSTGATGNSQHATSDALATSTSGNLLLYASANMTGAAQTDDQASAFPTTGWSTLQQGVTGSGAAQEGGAYQDIISTGQSNVKGSVALGTQQQWAAQILEILAAGGTTPITGSDSGAATETSSISATVSGTAETAIASETSTISATLSGSAESAAASETSALAATVSGTAETATATDTSSYSSTLSSSDSGAGAETSSLSANLASSESATATDLSQLQIIVPAGPDGMSVGIIPLPPLDARDRPRALDASGALAPLDHRDRAYRLDRSQGAAPQDRPSTL